MKQYTVETTDEQDKLIQAYCDAQPLNEEGNQITPEELVMEKLNHSMVNLVDKCKFGVSGVVANKYNEVDDAKKAQVDEILGVKAETP